MTSYIEQSLGRDEEIVATAKITGWVYFVPVLFTVFTMGLLFPILILPYLQRATTDLGVTNKRVIAKWGLISRRTVEQRIQKIESIRVNQGVVGRLFDYGTIMTTRLDADPYLMTFVTDHAHRLSPDWKDGVPPPVE